MPLNLQAVQNGNGLRTVSHARIPLVKPLGLELAALAVGVSNVLIQLETTSEKSLLRISRWLRTAL